MLFLIFGLILWFDGHLWRRFLPTIAAKLGRSGYALSLATIIIALGVMIYGYRSAEFIPVWNPPSFLAHINNLLMVVAIYTYFATTTKPGVVWLVGNIKHPQLTGFKIWTIAHLMVNGDLASIVLFGGLLAWAVLEVILINRQGETHDRSKAMFETRLPHLIIVAVAFVVIVMVHAWLGPSPFGG